MQTGEPIQTAHGYTGLAVIRGARIKEAGHGGQVLLSKSTAALIEDALMGGLSLRDLGPHRLKGLPHPERIFQLVIPDLPADFPPLQSLDARGLPRPGVAPRRVLTTALFVDMVGATERLVALGDRRWLEVRAQYTALIRQEFLMVPSPPSAAGARSVMLCAASGWRCGSASTPVKSNMTTRP
ncbi:MAG: hypothetical protein DMD81_16910 [Candidatus Rokuibacteriota bacterium]|nr:MAG: hypothetical protein DMD81_16910 [Candidatus Rokubacteria bacterium]